MNINKTLCHRISKIEYKILKKNLSSGFRSGGTFIFCTRASQCGRAVMRIKEYFYVAYQTLNGVFHHNPNSSKCIFPLGVSAADKGTKR